LAFVLGFAMLVFNDLLREYAFQSFRIFADTLAVKVSLNGEKES
jgi:hypothetical protein